MSLGRDAYLFRPGSNRLEESAHQAEAGAILTGPQREFCRPWPNQADMTVSGSHFIQEDAPVIQEDAPDGIGTVIAHFVRSLHF